MKILIISVITPYPIDTGGNAGTFKLINHARKENEVTFLSLPSSKSKIDSLKAEWPDVRVLTKEEVIPSLGFKDKIKLKIKDFLFKKPVKSRLQLDNTNLVDGFYEGFVQEVIELTTKVKFDLIQVEYTELAPIVFFLPKDVPNIFVNHELRYRRMEYEHNLMEEPTHSAFWTMQTTRILEVGLMNAYDKVFTVSEDDRKYLIESGGIAKKISSSPSPVEIVNRSINTPFKFQNKIVYLGPEAHYPNEDGVRWFLKECWPAISEKFPELEFHIVGKWQTETIEQLPRNSKVKFLGFVEDLGDVFEGAALVVPLRIGGGMRMKILEAISWNTPIITTSVGAEGLPMEHNVNCHIADKGSEFISAINRLEKTSDEFTTNAKKVIGNQFSVETCGKTRSDFYKELV